MSEGWGTPNSTGWTEGRVGWLSNGLEDVGAGNVQKGQACQGVEVLEHIAPQRRTLLDRLKNPLKTTG
jgi:hypothetical protein